MHSLGINIVQILLPYSQCQLCYFFLFRIQIFDKNIERGLYARLYYIVCTQNWESFSSHYWIKQCIEVRSSPHSSGSYEYSLFKSNKKVSI